MDSFLASPTVRRATANSEGSKMTANYVTATGGNVSVSGVAQDAAGDTFITGSLNGTANIGGTNLSSTAGTGGSGFVAKFDAAGNLAWVQLLGGNTGNAAYANHGQSITVDATGTHVYVGLSYMGTLDLPGGGSITAATANPRGAILDLSGSDGTTNYAIRIGSSGPGTRGVSQLVLDSGGNLYATGAMYDNSVDETFTGGDGVTKTITSRGGQGLYVLKATASTGALAWVAPVDTLSGDINGSSIAVDASGNVFMAGQYGSVAFGQSHSLTLATSGNYGGFLAKLDSAGSFQWAEGIAGGPVAGAGGTNYGAQYVGGVAVDASGNPYITGSFTDGARLDPGSSTQQSLPATSSTPYSSFPSYTRLNSAQRAFVEKFDTAGTSQWIATEGASGSATSQADSGTAIVVDSAGNVVTAGTLSGNAGASDIFGSTTLAAPGSVSNAYLWTLDQSGNSQFAGSFTSSTSTTGVSLAGNPSGSLSVGLTVGGTTDIAPSAADTTNVSPGGSGLIAVALSDLGNAACFAEGTPILTPRGEVPIERLRAGDHVVPARGGAPLPVVWVGWRRVDLARHPKPHDVQPIRIARDAFAPGMPSRDLWLSPDHGVFVDGVLVPARYLCNGASIRQEPRRSITYWHVEVTGHDILLAAGLPSETYLDTGNRAAFANGGAVVLAHPDFAQPAVSPAAFARDIWAARGAAPLVVGGPQRAAIHRRLRLRAAALGHRLAAEPGLHVALPGGRPRLLPSAGDGRLQFVLPPGTTALRLRSASIVPAELDAAHPDGRRLGVMVTRILVDGIDRPLDHAGLGAGWHAAEPGWRWTDGDAAIELGAEACLFEVALGAVLQYWQQPDAAEAVRLRA